MSSRKRFFFGLVNTTFGLHIQCYHKETSLSDHPAKVSTGRESSTGCCAARPRPGRISMSLLLVLVVILLILSGIGYRVLAVRLKLITEEPIRLPVALNNFPLQIYGWDGKDVPIPPNIQRVAGNDDFFNQWANIYIAYSARPRTMLGHRPQVCYVGGGWIHDSTEQSEVISNTGRAIPCLIHRFHMPAPGYEERVVLNFYIVNGQLTNDESGFSGIGWRTPNIAGNAARYVAQVQISSVLENSIRMAAKDMTELILDFFPDENSRVRVTENTNYSNSALK